jgi:hypothetical protein
MINQSKKMTFEEHVFLGGFLKNLHESMTHESVISSNLYGSKSSVATTISKLTRTINSFRSQLDGILARDFPDRFNPSVYYGERHYRARLLNGKN